MKEGECRILLLPHHLQGREGGWGLSAAWTLGAAQVEAASPPLRRALIRVRKARRSSCSVGPLRRVVAVQGAQSGGTRIRLLGAQRWERDCCSPEIARRGRAWAQWGEPVLRALFHFVSGLAESSLASRG